MSDKYTELLQTLSFDLLHLATSFAKQNCCPQIEPVHLFRGLLHKEAGLVNYIEDTLDEDYYYLVEWCDMRMQECPHSPYPMKGTDLSRGAEAVVKESVNLCERYGIDGLVPESLLAALVSPGVGFSAEQLRTMPLRVDKVLSTLLSSKDTVTQQPSHFSRKIPQETSDYCTSMMDTLPDAPIIGLENEVRSMIDVLARKDRANVLIIGDSGVGKTTLVQALIRMGTAGKMPASLRQAEFFELDLIALSQGVSYKGEIEDRFKKVLENLVGRTQPILFIENFHLIEDRQSVLNGILPYVKKILAKNQLQIICTATVDGYTKDIEKDKELMTLFEKITVEEPSEKQSTEILRSKCAIYEQFHHLIVAQDVPEEIVRLSKRYIPERRLPASAINLLDRAMASVKIDVELSAIDGQERSAVTMHVDDVRNVVSRMTGIPMGNIQSEERERLSNAESILHKRVVGQNHAIKSILDAVFESRSGLSKKGQPMGSFFFLGPTGTGKTELAKSLAEFLFNDESAILRFDMSEYKEEHSVALLYGAPPGYVGYEEGGLLVNQIRQHPYTVVLFDEIEKAHRSVFDLFLQILDEGKLHDRLGRVGDFSNSLIIFTSNIGSDYIFKAFNEGLVPTHDQMLEVMQGQFRPEFLARLTEIVPFSPITSEMIDRIFDIHLSNLLKMLHEQNITLKIDDSARKYVTQVGFNAHYGARPILGIIRKEIRRPLSKLIVAGDICPGDIVTMVYNPEKREISWEIDSQG